MPPPMANKRFTLKGATQNMYYPFYFDPTYVLVLIPLILAMIAQARVSGAFNRYAKVRARSNLTGAQMARMLLDSEGLQDVEIQRVGGQLSDHYDPGNQVLRLSESTYDSPSIAALGVAAHEAGHALQHRDGYGPLMLRSAAVPVANIGSNLAWPLFIMGMIFSWEPLMYAGIGLFALAVFFSLITLPVEFNASRRAMVILERDGYLAADEISGAKSVLSAAALTYVASAFMAIMQLLRLVLLSQRGRRR